MLRRTERILENIPVGSLGLIALTGCEELGKKAQTSIAMMLLLPDMRRILFLSMPAFRALVPEKRKALSPNLYAARTCT